jgi:hypothetical protein
MSSVIINGVKYTGNSVVVKNNKVIIDGIEIKSYANAVTITVEGDVEELTVDFCDSLVVSGNVGSLNTQSGNVKCKDVIGNLNLTSGDVECGNIEGSVQTLSGDIKCRNIGGGVHTSSGDIKYRK